MCRHWFCSSVPLFICRICLCIHNHFGLCTYSWLIVMLRVRGSSHLENSLAEIPQIEQETTQEVGCLAQQQQFWALNVRSAAGYASQNVWLSLMVSTKISFRWDFMRTNARESEQSEEFQQGKSSSIKRNTRTTSCQHVHFFSFKDLFFCIFAFA